MTSRAGHNDLVQHEITGQIIGSFFAVYNELGFGFLESVYRRSMYYELIERGMNVDEEAPIDVRYRKWKVGHFRSDLYVEHKVIVEIKSSEKLALGDRKQLANYLKATGIEVGLLLHFGRRATYERVVQTKRVADSQYNHQRSSPSA